MSKSGSLINFYSYRRIISGDMAIMLMLANLCSINGACHVLTLFCWDSTCREAKWNPLPAVSNLAESRRSLFSRD